jgi:hypothetical protein
LGTNQRVRVAVTLRRDLDLVGHANEERVAQLIRERWGLDVRHAPPYAAIDLYLFDGARLDACVEVKGGDYPCDRYPSTMLALRKYHALYNAETVLHARGLFVKAFSDCVRWIRVTDVPDQPEVRINGRTDRRGFANDQEGVLWIPTDLMVTL